MVKNTDKKPDEQESFTPTQQEFIKNLFVGENGIFSKPNNPQQTGLSNEDYKSLESIKWVLSMIYNKDFIRSATNLFSDEVDDINDALMINAYADCPELAETIEVRFELSRSRIPNTSNYDNVLKLISGIRTGINFNAQEGQESNNILGKLRR